MSNQSISRARWTTVASVVLSALLIGTASIGRAETVTFQWGGTGTVYNVSNTGGNQVVNTGQPFLTAVLSDSTNGEVKLIVSDTLVAGEDVREADFNINPLNTGLLPGLGYDTSNSSHLTPGFGVSGSEDGVNLADFKGFDVNVFFGDGNAHGLTNAYTAANPLVVYLKSAGGPLTASMFATATSTPGTNAMGPFSASAFVQTINGSNEVASPAPTVASAPLPSVAGSGLVLLGVSVSLRVRRHIQRTN